MVSLKPQRGSSVLIMLLLLVLLISSLLLQPFTADRIIQQRLQHSDLALAQAKQTLLGYAGSYHDTHPGQGLGYLPCPDRNAGNGEGSSSLNCAGKNISQLGRLPWRTLELTAIRDGDYQCLWYVVSGSFKNNPKTDLLNWDTPGQLQLFSQQADSPVLAPEQQIAALLIAPGLAVTGQQRHSLPASRQCQGNYQPANYLDNASEQGINNAELELAPAAINPFISGDIYHHGHRQVNDRILAITRQEIFHTILQRHNFAAEIDLLRQQLANCLAATLPTPVQLNFNHSPISETLVASGSNTMSSGRIPKSCFPAPWHNWQDQLLYRRCDDASNCQQINGTACKGVIIFSGQRQPPQRRDTPEARNDWANYLESPLHENFSLHLPELNANSAFDRNHPSADLINCIH